MTVASMPAVWKYALASARKIPIMRVLVSMEWGLDTADLRQAYSEATSSEGMQKNRQLAVSEGL
jgi:hypothetical protein